MLTHFLGLFSGNVTRVSRYLFHPVWHTLRRCLVFLCWCGLCENNGTGKIGSRTPSPSCYEAHFHCISASLQIQCKLMWMGKAELKKNNTEVAFAQCAVTPYCKEDFLLFTCRISSEDGFNNVSCEIISQTVAAVCLRPNICLRSIKYVLTFMEILPTGFWVFQFYIFNRNKVKKKKPDVLTRKAPEIPTSCLLLYCTESFFISLKWFAQNSSALITWLTTRSLYNWKRTGSSWSIL